MHQTLHQIPVDPNAWALDLAEIHAADLIARCCGVSLARARTAAAYLRHDDRLQPHLTFSAESNRQVQTSCP